MQSLSSHFSAHSSALIEITLNRLLRLDAEAQYNMRALHQKSIAIHVTDFDIQYCFKFVHANVVVSPRLPENPSATISGQAKAFLTALGAEHTGDSLFTGELHFSGEIGVAKQFETFAKSLRIDWQEPFAEVFGDSAGHFLSQGVLSTTHWLLNWAKQTRQDIPEILQEEIKVTPCQQALQNFYEEIDQVRSQAERLEARVKRIQNK